jgi:hypothetical protein
VAHHLSVRGRRGAAAAAGTIVHVISWHDNTSANKWNPNRKLGRLGQRSIDEMSFAWVTLTYLDQDDFDMRVAARREQR